MKTLYYNGDIITVNDAQPMAEAICIENGKILAVGQWEELKSLQDNQTNLVDLEGKAVLPGFIDGHGHVGNLLVGLPKLYPSPAGSVNSLEELFFELKQLASKEMFLENGWFIAMGYDNAFFEGNRHPNRLELDEISKDVPMVVLHVSGHVGVANSKALEIAGWTKDTPSPAGGVIQKDGKTGELTGLLEEKAIMDILFGHGLIGMTIEGLAKGFQEAQKYYASQGITTAQDGGTTPEVIDAMAYCQQNDMMLIDINAYPMLETFASGITTSTLDSKFNQNVKITGAKVVGDGSPQAKTAWLTKPYYKKPDYEAEGYLGYPIYTDEQVYNFCKQCLENNWQLLMHCNGDAMGDQFIKAYDQAKKELNHEVDLRPVMIHAQTVREDQLEDMKRLGIIPSFFHDHTFYWGDYHLDSTLGPERGARISPLQSALQRGIKFTMHQDTPVAPPNMIFTLHNAVNRKTRQGRDIGPEYAITIMDAIKAMTINGAHQYFDEDIKGTLEVGKYADLVILDQNPLTVEKEKIKDIRVLETIKEGKTIYKAE